MQATTTRMLKQNGIAYDVTRKGTLIVIGGVEHRSEDIQFTAIGVKTDYAPGEIDGTVIENGDIWAISLTIFLPLLMGSASLVT